LRVADDWPEPSAGSGQVIVRVRGVGICGSDLALLSGERRLPQVPWVPGHEAFGEVTEIGDGVDPSRIGQRVVVEPNFPCLRCVTCLAGLTSMCPDRVVIGFNAQGLLAERVVVPAAFAWPVPSDWTDADAVCTEPLTVALAAIERSGAGLASRCLVIGAGSQGALLCVALAARGITPYVLEPLEGRQQLAVELGARLAGPADLDFATAFETSGAQAALGEAVSRAGHGAMVLLIGLSSQISSLDTGLVVRRQLTLRGSMIYDHPDHFAATLKSAIPAPGRVLRACYPLEEAAAAFHSARAAPGKTWIAVDS
jgi:alcohol dehydrogenase/L-iditol 2-dehydrogenase